MVTKQRVLYALRPRVLYVDVMTSRCEFSKKDLLLAENYDP